VFRALRCKQNFEVILLYMKEYRRFAYQLGLLGNTNTRFAYPRLIAYLQCYSHLSELRNFAGSSISIFKPKNVTASYIHIYCLKLLMQHKSLISYRIVKIIAYRSFPEIFAFFLSSFAA
jgi:hypothetical protein